MDTVISAGGNPKPGDPLYEFALGESKALIKVAGKRMIQWVLDAISDAKLVDHVVIVGLDAGSGVTCKKPLSFVPDHGAMIDNIRAGTAKVMELNPKADYVLLVSSDIPTITADMVDWTIRTALETKHEMYYNVVLQETMETRFPGSSRSFTKLKDVVVCGGDMNIVATDLVMREGGLWTKLSDARKNVFKQAALIGFDTLFNLVFRRMTLEGAEKKVGSNLGVNARAILCPYAEIGMDIDKPQQLELLQKDLSQASKT